MSSPRQSLVEMAQGYHRGKALCAAVRLGIPDALAQGPQDLVHLAEVSACDPGGLSRLLRALASFGMVAEIAPSRFQLTELGRPLCQDAPDSVWASMIFWADLLADQWTYLPDCVRAGGIQGGEAARLKDGSPSRFSREPDSARIFHAVFAEPGAADYGPLAAAYDFSRAGTVCDLGGAGGGLLAAILVSNPLLKGILVDRAEAMAGAQERFEETGLFDRAQAVVGDLLEAVPSGADIYTMKSVLHGMGDEQARQVLRNCRAVLKTDSRLLLMEVVLPELVASADPEVERLMFADLNMLVVTGGLERSLSQWTALVESAGLRVLGMIPGGGVGIIECRLP